MCLLLRAEGFILDSLTSRIVCLMLRLEDVMTGLDEAQQCSWVKTRRSNMQSYQSFELTVVHISDTILPRGLDVSVEPCLFGRLCECLNREFRRMRLHSPQRGHLRREQNNNHPTQDLPLSFQQPRHVNDWREAQLSMIDAVLNKSLKSCQRCSVILMRETGYTLKSELLTQEAKVRSSAHRNAVLEQMLASTSFHALCFATQMHPSP